MRSNTPATNNRVFQNPVFQNPSRQARGLGRAAAKSLLLRRSLRSWIVVPAVLSLALAGCSHVPNQFAEDGPASTGDMESASAMHAAAHYQASSPRQRSWPQTVTAAQSGAVQHWPLYTEDPFEDKGTDRPDSRNKYYIGWEDYVAMPYGFARFTLNWIALPVSMGVQPPWTLMESDGELSQQCLGYDHDATEAEHADSPPYGEAARVTAPGSAPSAK